MRRWRIPIALSVIVVLGQLWRTSPLIDVISLRPPEGVRLSYPLFHVVFAPFTMTADWLNGGSRQDLKDFLVWFVLVYVLVRLARAPRTPTSAPREIGAAGLGVCGLALFFLWAIFAARPIPRLAAADADALVYDLHSHTSASHDGRRGFGATQNALWHARAGFDAAFITDHNVWGAVEMWRKDSADRPPRLLDGEELSLSGLHLLVLGNTTQLSHEPANGSWDSTLALARRLVSDSILLVASLPEYWRNHWGDELGQLAQAGVQGFEIWTTSPAAMDFPEPFRQRVIARARLSNLALFGATDMHGLGHTASVWNLTRLPGWRHMSDRELQRALVGALKNGGYGGNVVIAMRRWLTASRTGQAMAVPAGTLIALRSASPAHALALLVWIWATAWLSSRMAKPAP